jgi:hypothetical protein
MRAPWCAFRLLVRGKAWYRARCPALDPQTVRDDDGNRRTIDTTKSRRAAGGDALAVDRARSRKSGASPAAERFDGARLERFDGVLHAVTIERADVVLDG